MKGEFWKIRGLRLRRICSSSPFLRRRHRIDPTVVEIDFEEGIPKRSRRQRSLSGQSIGPSLNELGGQNGIGRVDMVENRYVGMKSRGVYETPGGTILQVAHRAMESITMDREVMHLRDSLVPKLAELIYYGYWFSPEMEVLKKADR